MHFADPHTNILQMGLASGMHVGDFGTGTGHYALAAAKIVGEEGKVYAVDVQKDVLTRLGDEAHRKGLWNIELVWGDIEKKGNVRIPEGSLDAIILSNTLFQVEHREGVIEAAAHLLKRGGKLLLIDWTDTFSGMGPAQELIITEVEAERLFIAGGFKKVKAFPGGPHHYSILFQAS